MRYQKEWIDTVKQRYSTDTAKEIANSIGISEVVVYRIANRYGIRKPKEWIENPKSGGFKKGRRNSPATEFKKGGVPHNKGKKVTPEAYAKMSGTFFKPGGKPFNHKPMYSISIRADKTGIPYRFIKIRADYWELLHRHVWMEANGPIPKNMVIAFKDGNSMNCDLSNLEMITRQSNMLRNSSNNIPDELREVVKYKNKLIKKIQEHGKKQNQ